MRPYPAVWSATQTPPGLIYTAKYGVKAYYQPDRTLLPYQVEGDESLFLYARATEAIKKADRIAETIRERNKGRLAIT